MELYNNNNNNNNNSNNNNDNNDSNRKGKTLVVATKKTLEIKKKTFFLDFWNETALKFSSFVFNNQSSLFCCNYFLFSYYYHYRNHYYCLSYSHIIYFIFNLSLYILYQVLFLFYYFSVLFFFRLFISYFEFIFVPFSSFIYFFAIFVSLCASNESIKCFICMLSFLILSPLAFCKYYKKNAKIIRTIGKTQVPFAFVLVLLYVLSWTIHFIHYLHISHNAPFLPSKIFHNLCFSFILGITAVPRETENNASTQNFGRQIKYIMRDVQVAYFSPSSHTCHWTGHPTPSPTSLPGSSPTQPQKGTLGTRFPRAWRSSAIHVFLV